MQARGLRDEPGNIAVSALLSTEMNGPSAAASASAKSTTMTSIGLPDYATHLSEDRVVAPVSPAPLITRV